MKGKSRNTARCLTFAISVAAILPAHAMIPVFDIPNFFVNLGIKKQLIDIRKGMGDKEDVGSVTYNTLWIDKSTRNIDKSTVEISETTNNLLTITAQYNQWNYDIDNSFTWIINNGGGEIIPIPREVKDKLKAILGEQSIDQYTGHYRAASDFTDFPDGGFKDEVALEGSRSRKAANDALVEAVSREQEAIDGELVALSLLAKKAGDPKNRQGQGHQLQIANALAASQVNQMMKLRSMMLVSEAARAAEFQVSAEKDARAIAIGRHMRAGLETAAQQSLAPRPAY